MKHDFKQVLLFLAVGNEAKYREICSKVISFIVASAVQISRMTVIPSKKIREQKLIRAP